MISQRRRRQDEPFPIRTAQLDGPGRRRRHRGCGVRQLDRIDRPERRLERRRAAAAAAASAPPRRSSSSRPAPIAAASAPNGGKVVRWFIGLGTGGKPEQIAAEQKFADRLQRRRQTRTRSTCRIEIYDNTRRRDTLQIEIAAGNPPDIIGPVGVEGLNIFRDQLLDLAPLVASRQLST